MIERQEIHCHECNRYVQFDIDMSLNGNHVLNCPNCGHEHCRVVRNGRITDIRWASWSPTYTISSAITVTTSVWLTAGSTSTTAAGRFLLAQSWLNTSSTS